MTDHHHYWEDGGATYHQRYRTHEFVRGQEGDWWKGRVGQLRDGDGIEGLGMWPEGADKGQCATQRVANVDSAL